MNTMTNYDSIDEALNTSSAIDVTPSSKPQKVESTKDDVKKDYDYTRANLYSLVEKGQEALNGILEVAGEGGSARAYEVCLLYTSPSPRDRQKDRMPSSA